MLPHLWNLHIYWLVQCVVVLYIKRFSQFLCAWMCMLLSVKTGLVLSFPPTGPSYSCHGACWRGLGHIRALFGQAWPMSLCCFWWGPFLFLSPLQNSLILVSCCCIIYNAFTNHSHLINHVLSKLIRIFVVKSIFVLTDLVRQSVFFFFLYQITRPKLLSIWKLCSHSDSVIPSLLPDPTHFSRPF